MTDKEIIQLAEKTREEKYCNKYHNKQKGCWNCPLFKSYGMFSECMDKYYNSLEYTRYFTDGFKAAISTVKTIMDDLIKTYTDNDDFNFVAGAEYFKKEVEESMLKILQQ